MNVQASTQAYERWLSRQTPLIAADLREKHRLLAKGALSFLQGTFYRWVQLWPERCAECASAPVVLAVGDLHVGNFGTWRDAEGRLVWGVNDFDESAPMPYTLDLVRLAASARLAIRDGDLDCDPSEASDAILEGYAAALRDGGQPFVLAESHPWLRDLAQKELRNPRKYWAELRDVPTFRGPIPANARALLTRNLTAADGRRRFIHRRAGVGNLGRRRFAVICERGGGLIAREVKALAASAWWWQRPERSGRRIWYSAIAARAVRVPDPFLVVRDGWVARRLAPDCRRIELDDLPRKREELQLLHAMGRETANLHLGTPRAISRVTKDLARRPARWLREAAARMGKAVLRDWRQWRESRDRT